MKTISVQCRGERTFGFAAGRTALLSIDMQREFFTDEAGPCADEMRGIVPRVSQLLGLARTLGCAVIHTRESYMPDLSDVSPYRRSLGYVGRQESLGRLCILGQPGHEFVGDVKPAGDEPVIDKASFGAFYQTDLHDRLQAAGVDHLILCGVTTQCCVHSTLREAVDRGYWCLTVADCCAATEPGLHDAALRLIAGEGHLFGWVCDLEDMQRAVSD